MSMRPSPQTTTISAPGGNLTRTAWDQLGGHHDMSGWAVIAIKARKEQPGCGPPQRRRILRDHGNRRIEQVGKLEVVEANEPDAPMEPELPECPHSPDGDEVLSCEECRWGISRGQQVCHCLLR